jgi:hypothetical protein
MKLKPFAEVIALSKEKLSEALAPIRARKVRSQAELEMAKLDDELNPLGSRGARDVRQGRYKLPNPARQAG